MVAKERAEDERDERTELAWQIERIGLKVKNKKQLRPLQEYLLRPPRPPTAEEQRFMFQAISARYGLRARKVRLIRRELTH